MSSIIACGGASKFMAPLSLPQSFNSFAITQNKKMKNWGFSNTRRNVIIKASSDVVSPSIWENWKPPKSSSTPSFSDILWPSAGSFPLFFSSFLIPFLSHYYVIFSFLCSSGAFVAVAILGKLDQLLTPKGLSITVAPLGAVSALLFASPLAPSARVRLLVLSHFRFNLYIPSP